MRAFLMHRDRDFDVSAQPPPGAADLVQDLAIEILFDAMAGADPFLMQVVRRAALASLDDLAAIAYRQDVLRDCLENPAIVRGLYALAVEAIEREKKGYWGLTSRNPGYLLHRSAEMLSMFVEMLRRLRSEAESQAHRFASEGFGNMFAMLRRELDDDYLGIVEGHLAHLKFRRGVLVSAGLGKGNAGTRYMLRRPNADGSGWVRRLLARRPPAYTVRIHERDESGARALAELRDRGIAAVAGAATQASEHILSFFHMLRTELAFYVGCLNLHERLSQIGAPICLPVPVARGERRHAADDLYDVCLALTSGRPVVGNDLACDGAALVVITGANQGGKSTFLRSIGLAQLMMQCGMFVPARSYRATLHTGLFTHYRREEDATMRRGKLAEELQRASAIVDRLAPDSLLLFNEPFQSTNEREGSEIGRQLIAALVEGRVTVFLVTHIYELARSLRESGCGNGLFLRAERSSDGTRAFKIRPGAPLPTSYGKDLYDRIFGAAAAPARRPDGPG